MFPRDYFLKINRTFYFFKLHLSLISDWHIQDSLILSAEVSSDSSCYSNQHHRAVPRNRGCVFPRAREEGLSGWLCRWWDLSLWAADRWGLEAQISSHRRNTRETRRFRKEVRGWACLSNFLTLLEPPGRKGRVKLKIFSLITMSSFVYSAWSRVDFSLSLFLLTFLFLLTLFPPLCWNWWFSHTVVLNSKLFKVIQSETAFLPPCLSTVLQPFSQSLINRIFFASTNKCAHI